MTRLSDPFAPLAAPPSAGVDASSLQAAEVLLVHVDGTIDVRLVSSRATRTGVPVVSGAAPAVGSRVVLGHLGSDPQSPVALSPAAFDTTPIGTVLTWSQVTVPAGYVAADGARHSRSAYPQAYDVATRLAGAGDPDWSVRTTDETFTVPNPPGAVTHIVKVHEPIAGSGVLQGPAGVPASLDAARLATLNAGTLEARGGTQAGGAEAGDNIPAGTVLHVRRNRAGDMLEVKWTPKLQCWWRVDGRMIAHENASAWGRADVCIELSGATDARGAGYNRGPIELLQSSTTVQGAAAWDTARPTALFKLPAGVEATARIRFLAQTSAWRHWHDPAYQGITTHVTGFW